jgi:glycosyltransferase involved in cell wall biosynthesis
MSEQRIKALPFVSICTPTFNRRPFISIMFEMFRNQTYPKQNIEWIIIDDGTDKIEDLIETSGIPQIKYFYFKEKMKLGKKRNLLHSKCKGDIIVYMDDDDYYMPERISHAVETLLKNPWALCAGSSEIYTYFKQGLALGKMIQFGPYGPFHATAGTFAFRKELLEKTSYNEEQALGEEREFLKNYTIPFVQLDPMKTILVFSHEHNTFDKRKMLENPNPQCVKESTKKVEDFIRLPKEERIKHFFLNEIDALLEKYEHGKPQMKPDVLEQIKRIEKEREEQQLKSATIVMQKPGESPVPLSQQQILDMIQQQQKTIKEQHSLIEKLQQGAVLFANQNGEQISLNHSQILEQIKQMHIIIEGLKKEMLEKDNIIQNLQKQLVHAKLTGKTIVNKSEPEFPVVL